MTKILAIEGTNIRLEVNDCAECPCWGGRFGQIECEVRGHHDRRRISHPLALDAEWISPDCPLPEKVNQYRSTRWVRARLWWRGVLGGGTVRLKSGVYRFQKPITIPPGVTMVGGLSTTLRVEETTEDDQ